MVRRTGAGVTEAQRAGRLRFRVCDQLLYVRDGHGRMNDHHGLTEADQRNRREGLDRIERRLVPEIRADGNDRLSKIQRVTVGIRTRRDLHAEHAARARPAVDDHALPEQLTDFVSRDARHRVADAARLKARNEAQRTRRKVGGVLCPGDAAHEPRSGDASKQLLHRQSTFAPASRTTFRHLTSSLLMSAPNSSGVLACRSMP